MATAGSAAGRETIELGRAVLAHGFLKGAGNLLHLVPALRHRQSVALQQVAPEQQHVRDVDAGQAQHLTVEGHGLSGCRGDVVEGDPVTGHQIVQDQDPALGCKLPQHDLIGAHEIKRRVVISERVEHLLEHLLDRADADPIPRELRRNAGLFGEPSERRRQILERPPILLIDPDDPVSGHPLTLRS